MFSQRELPAMDYLFAGAGASATLLLIEMERRGMLKGKRVLIVDPSAKSTNDKTYCFWAHPSENLTVTYKSLISHAWESVSINRRQPEALFPLRYVHVSSLDLYVEQRRIIEAYGLQRVHAAVFAIEARAGGVCVKTNEGDWYSTSVFDSRPPSYFPPQQHQIHLLQSFIGLVIETEIPLADAQCMDLMDFTIEQLGWTQFVYALPFDSHRVLVELTRFGKTPLSRAEAEPLLERYIFKRFGSFSIVGTETGCIPMSSAKIRCADIPGVVPIGGRAGAVKPSTGYAFKQMAAHAHTVARCVQQGIQPPPIKRHRRFVFYDRLLLLVLSEQAAQGKPLFDALFKRNNIQDVLRFLDEKSSRRQDVRILMSLPLKPFLRACWVHSVALNRQLVAPLFTLLLAMGLLLLYTLAPSVLNWLEPLLFSVGLFVVGIPHGAVDYLAESGNLGNRIRAPFVVRYLVKAIFYLFIWVMFPTAAFLFFIAYSAWHFGQGDMNEWKIRSKLPFKKLGWGSLVLGIILCGHAAETNQVLGNMGIALLALSAEAARAVSVLLVCLALAWGCWEGKRAMVLSGCMLAVGIGLPLVTAFALYFIGQHSVQGWAHLKQGLHTDNLGLFKKAFPFTAGALLLVGALFYGMETGFLNAFDGHWLTAFFVFISCISFPHVLAMNRFYGKG